MSITVEFYGGPWDGRVTEVADDHSTELRFRAFAASPQDEDAATLITEGIYKRARHTRFGDPWRFDWQGER